MQNAFQISMTTSFGQTGPSRHTHSVNNPSEMVIRLNAGNAVPSVFVRVSILWLLFARTNFERNCAVLSWAVVEVV